MNYILIYLSKQKKQKVIILFYVPFDMLIWLFLIWITKRIMRYKHKTEHKKTKIQLKGWTMI